MTLFVARPSSPVLAEELSGWRLRKVREAAAGFRVSTLARPLNGPADAVGVASLRAPQCSEPCGHTKDALKRMSACALIRSRVVSLSEAHPNPTTTV